MRGPEYSGSLTKKGRTTHVGFCFQSQTFFRAGFSSDSESLEGFCFQFNTFFLAGFSSFSTSFAMVRSVSESLDPQFAEKHKEKIV